MGTFSRLRQLFLEKPSPEIWIQLCNCLQNWSEKTPQSLAISYASEHLETWDDSLRWMEGFAFRSPCWPLVRALRVPNQFSKQEALTFSQDPLFSKISGLESSLFSYQKLQGWEVLPPHIQSLSVSGCSQLQSLERFRGWKSLEQLQLKNAHSIESLAVFSELTSLRSLSVEDAHSLFELSHSSDFSLLQLKKITVQGSSSFASFRGLECFPNLETLVLVSNSSLSHLSSFPKHGALRELALKKNHWLGSLQGIENLSHLEKIELSQCKRIQELDSLLLLPHIREIKIQECEKVQLLPKKHQCVAEFLEQLQLLVAIKNSDQETLQKQTRLDLYHMQNVTNLRVFRTMEGIQEFVLPRRSKVKSLAWLGKKKELRLLDVSLGYKIEDWSALAFFPNLETLRLPYNLQNATSIPLDTLSCLKTLSLPIECLDLLLASRRIHSIQRLTLTHCLGNEDLASLPKMEALEELHFVGYLALGMLHSKLFLPKVEKVSFTFLVQDWVFHSFDEMWEFVACFPSLKEVSFPVLHLEISAQEQSDLFLLLEKKLSLLDSSRRFRVGQPGNRLMVSCSKKEA